MLQGHSTRSGWTVFGNGSCVVATHGIAAKYSSVIKESVLFEVKTRLCLSLSVLKYGSLEVFTVNKLSRLLGEQHHC